MEEQDVYQITVTVAPVADNDKGLRMTFTDMVTGAMIEWQIEDVNGKEALRLLYAAFTDDALEEMFEMIMTTVEETRKALNDGTD